MKKPIDSYGPIISEIIRSRCTTKAMDDKPWPCSDKNSQLIQQILAAARDAPFHKPAAKENRSGVLCGIQPWRCYYLDSTRCRKLRQLLIEKGDATKIPKMLAVSDFLIQVTWLPDPKSSEIESLFEASIQNMEHIAAASAAIQNMLLAATARNIPNYWSSGGALRTPEISALLEIPATEILLGSIFLFPQDLSGAETSSGALRASRSPAGEWSRPVSL